MDSENYGTMESNDIIEKCVTILFEQASTFTGTIELVQKLAQMLKLDTFLDKDAYTHVFETSSKDVNKKAEKFQRISIAGSSTLIDIDYTFDNRVIQVSLSLADGEGKQEDFKEDGEVGKIQDTSETSEIVTVGKPSKEFYLLGEGNNTAEHILKKNLEGTTFGGFPQNLMYLAKFDKIYTKDNNAISYLAAIANAFKVLHDTEMKQHEDWIFKNGYGTFGKVKVNSDDENQIGLLLEYWHDFRYLNMEPEIKEHNKDLGNRYQLLLSISHVPTDADHDFLSQMRENNWILGGASASSKTYRIHFDESLLKPFRNMQGYQMCFNLVKPVTIPRRILELIRLNDYEVTSKSLHCIFEQLNKGDSTHLEITLQNGQTLKFGIVNIIFQDYVKLKSFTLENAADISIVLSVIRNFTVLEHILQLIYERKVPFLSVINGSFDATQTGTISEIARHKLIETLKLTDDVTDEELMNIQAATDSTNFSTLDTKSETHLLDEFMRSAGDQNNLEDFYPDENSLLLSIDECDFSSSNFDLKMSMDGKIQKGTEFVALALKFRISNGAIERMSQYTDQESVDIQSSKIEDIFIENLNQTEDLIRVVEHIHKS